MKARWQALAARFAALKPREKYLVCGALAAAILLGGDSLWIAPGTARKALLERQIGQDRTDLADLQAQIAALQARIKEPDAANRVALAQARQRLAELDSRLQGFDKLLVAPQRMSNVLQALLASHRGLELVSLKTLEPTPVIEHPADKSAAKTADAGNIYKHGIEIKLAGGYQDLLAYLDEMENSPQRLLLGKMSLAVARHPRVELTLTVYSLSLDRTWLII